MKQGKVILVGAGPSDAGLFTLRGREVLEQADVVVYDALVGQAILGMIPPRTRRINVGKHAGNHPVPQEEINRILLREAQAGNLVARLKGGDPFLFGRGGEELELLCEAGISFEIVPGVTSALAVPAYAGIPVTHRDFCSSVHIITGHTRKNAVASLDYKALVRLDGTLVFLMGVAALAGICTRLLAAGMNPETPAAVLERGTTAAQRRIVSTLAGLPAAAERACVVTPAIIVVGKVCVLAEQFAWAEQRPLGGKKILVTRPRASAAGLTRLLRHNGAEVVELPSIETVVIEPNPPLADALAHIADYGWLVFTSPAGALLFLQYLQRGGIDIRRLGAIKLAALGRATARELEERGLCVALVPAVFSAAALGEALAGAAGGERVLIVRAKEGTPALTDALDGAGVSYDDIALYETCYESGDADAVCAMLDADEISYVAFTSASTVRGFVRTLGARDYSHVRAACIGESTAKQAAAYEMQIMVADTASMESMVALMAREKEEREDGTVK